MVLNPQMPRRTRSIARRWPWGVAACYAAGLCAAAWLLAGAAQVTSGTALSRPLQWPAPGWMLWLVLLPGLAGACGFAAAWSVFGARWRQLPPLRSCVAALAAGSAFPWLSALLLPLLAAMHAGAWPLLAWCVLGSALMVWPVTRAVRVVRRVQR